MGEGGFSELFGGPPKEAARAKKLNPSKVRLYPPGENIAGYEQNRNTGFYNAVKAALRLTPEQQAADQAKANQRRLNRLYQLLATATSEKAKARITREIEKLGGSAP